MKIISWNVNGIRACVKKGFFDYIKSQKADLVCLQETKATQEQCKEFAEEFKGWESSWHSAKRPGYSGVMTMHRKAPSEITLGMGQELFDSEGRVLISDLKDFYLLNMYFPNGGSGEPRHLFKMEFLSKILPFFKKLEKKKPLVLTGDFNIAHKAIDIHDPVRLDGTSGFMPEERDWMDQLVDAGFVDLFRHFNPEKKDEYSWWSYRQGSRKRNKGWRIDYFFSSRALAGDIKSMRMDQQIEGSDHCPLVLEFR